MGILDSLIEFFIEQDNNPTGEYYYYDGDSYINADTGERSDNISEVGIVVAYPTDYVSMNGW